MSAAEHLPSLGPTAPVSSLESYAALFHSSPIATLLLQAEGVLYTNPAAVNLLGTDLASSGELVSELFRLNHTLVTQWHQALSGQQALLPMAYQWRCVDGPPLPVEVNGWPAVVSHSPTLIVTLQQRNEGGSEQFAEAQSLAGIGSWELDLRTNHISWSSELYRLYGWEPWGEPLSIERIRAVLPPEDQQLFEAAVQDSVARGVPYTVRHRVNRPDGTTAWLLSRGRVVRDAAGTAVRMFGTAQDISLQQQAESAQTALAVEQELRQQAELAQRRLEETLESVQDGFSTIGPDGCYRYLNAAGLRILERTWQEVEGRPVGEAFPAFNAAGLAGELRRAMQDRVDTSWIGYDEALRKWLDVRLYPTLDGGLTCSFSDVTEARQASERTRELNRDLQRRVAELQTLLDVLPVGIAIAEDAACRRIQVNPALAHLLGVEAEENVSASGPAADRLPYQVLHHGAAIPAAELPMQIAAGQGIDVRDCELQIVRRDGQTILVSAHASPLFDEAGRPRGAIGAFVDVTERRQAEEELLKQAKDLARSNADLQQFAYVTSHDLQEPLRMIASYAQLLVRRYRGRIDGDVDDFIGYIVDGVQRMETLIRDLLLYSRVVSTEESPTVQVALAGAVRWALMNLQQAVEESRAQIAVGELPTIQGDQIQLVQLFQNLIGNALKYRSEAPPKISISAELAGEYWLFTIRDNGVGIDPQYHERIFGIFKRLHGKEVPGTGIGLALCRKVVEKHHGRIWVESAVGAGSAFHFTLLH